MVREKRLVVMWVAPEFRTKIKVESAQNNMSIADFTRKAADMPEFKSLFEEKHHNGEDCDGDKRKRRFNLGF